MRPVPPDFPGRLPPRRPLPADPAPLLKTGSLPRKAAGFVVSPPPAAGQALRALLGSLGLPADELSAGLLEFARQFALPLDPAALRRLRQDALAGPAAKQAGALAVVAAWAKGVHLEPSALAAYAAAIDPDSANPRDGGGGQSPDGGRQRRRRREEDPPDAATLRTLAGLESGPGTLLSLLNRVPEPSGTRWIVIPFHFSSGAVEFAASLRLLLADDVSLDRQGRRLALDVSGPRRRWLIVLDRPGQENSWASISMDPPLADTENGASFQRLRSALAPYARRVTVDLTGVRSASFADVRAAPPEPVDEEA